MDKTQLALKFALLLDAVFICMILFWVLRSVFLGRCTRCNHPRSLGGQFCVKCGARYD
jgi:hypothetical protein